MDANNSTLELAYGDYSFKAANHGAALYFHEKPHQIWNGTHPIWDSSTTFNTNTVVTFCCDSSVAVLMLAFDPGTISDAGYLNMTNLTECLYGQYEVTAIASMNIDGNLPYLATVTLEADGDLTITKISVQQVSSFESDNSTCDLPNKCGPYGLCSSGSSCTCPLNSTHFTSTDASNQAAGCQFTTKYHKSGIFQMISQSGIDYYMTAFSSPNQTNSTEEVCYQGCSSASSCNAAFSNASFSAVFKLCHSPYKRSHIILIAALAAGVPCFVVLIIGISMYVRSRALKAGEEEDVMLSNWLSETTLRRFPLKELEKIAVGFSEKLGEGTFETVYKGQLSNGNYVAVKTLGNRVRQEAKDFYAEVSILRRVRHFNLVQLLGYCSNTKIRALVYEYMGNGSLDHHLLGNEVPLLSWKSRMEIAIGSARGMAYLHEECSEKIFHLDVKPQNILLDGNFCPKISDFGLSRLLDRAEDAVLMNTICGTPGYWAPKLIRGEAIGVESDVYSFGVVLLQIRAGVRPMEPKAGEFWNLVVMTILYMDLPRDFT